MSETDARSTVEVLVPADPPALDEAGWRALFDLLTHAAEADLGPEWRSILAERAEAGR